MFGYISLHSAILVPNNSFRMLANILLFQNYSCQICNLLFSILCQHNRLRPKEYAGSSPIMNYDGICLMLLNIYAGSLLKHNQCRPTMANSWIDIKVLVTWKPPCYIIACKFWPVFKVGNFINNSGTSYYI